MTDPASVLSWPAAGIGRARLAAARRRPTRCAGAGPASTSPPWARRRGWRPGWCPSAATRCAPCRGCRCRAARTPRLLRLPAALTGEIEAAAAVLREVRRRRRRRVRRLCLDGRLPRGAPAAPAVRRARGQHPPGLANRLGARFTAVRRDDVRRHPAAARRPHRHAAAARDHRPRPGRRARPRREPGSGSTRGRTDAARHRRLARCAAAQPDLRGRVGRPARRRHPGAAPGRRRQGLRAGPGRCRRPRLPRAWSISTTWPRPTPPPTPSSAGPAPARSAS